MEQEEGREMPDGVESQTGYCRFCGQAGMVHTLTGWSQEDVDEAVTCKCECDAAKKYAESKERVQKAKSRITELFGNTAERPIDQDVVNGGKFTAIATGEHYNQGGQQAGSRRDTWGPGGRGKHPGK